MIPTNSECIYSHVDVKTDTRKADSLIFEEFEVKQFQTKFLQINHLSL